MGIETWKSYVKKALQKAKRADKIDKEEGGSKQRCSYLANRSDDKHGLRQTSAVSRDKQTRSEPEMEWEIRDSKYGEGITTFEDFDAEEGEDVARGFGGWCDVCGNREERCIKILDTMSVPKLPEQAG